MATDLKAELLRLIHENHAQQAGAEDLADRINAELGAGAVSSWLEAKARDTSLSPEIRSWCAAEAVALERGAGDQDLGRAP
jgi:hypothetical protein